MRQFYIYSRIFIIYFVIIVRLLNCYCEELVKPEAKIDLNYDDDNYNEDDYLKVEADPVRELEKIENFVGTNLFKQNGCAKKCFSSEDVALLAARKEFEYLLPKDLPKTLLCDELVTSLMQYFYAANQVIIKMSNENVKMFAERAFYDALGGYFNFYMVPISRLSFYAGVITLKTAENIMEVYKQSKIFLNTNGNGWKRPISDVSEFDIQIAPLQVFVKTDANEISCIHLDMSDDTSENDDNIIVSLPRIDPEENGLLSNIWLPFKRKQNFNLRSCFSAYIFLKYFETVSRCYKYQGVDQKSFNQQLKEWIEEHIEIHLEDDVLYPGLGAIMRIRETLRRSKPCVLSIPSQESSKITKSAKAHGKREKSKEYKKIEKQSKHLSADRSDGVINRIFGRAYSKATVDQMDDDDEDEYEDDYGDWSVEGRRKKYITIAAILVVVMLLFVICVALATKLWKNRRRVPNLKTPNKTEKQKSRSFCDRLKNCGRRYDEEIALDPQSPSVLDTKKKKQRIKESDNDPRSSASSATTDCFSICGKGRKQTVGTKNKQAAIIDTSSMESLSPRKVNMEHASTPSSPTKLKLKSKSPTKKVTIDDKNKKFSISKKKKDGDKEGVRNSTQKDSLGRIGKKTGNASSEWETTDWSKNSNEQSRIVETVLQIF